jgi:hypothetical protein
MNLFSTCNFEIPKHKVIKMTKNDDAMKILFFCEKDNKERVTL